MGIASESTELETPPWMTPEEYLDTMRRALDGDGDALHALFFGPAPE